MKKKWFATCMGILLSLILVACQQTSFSFPDSESGTETGYSANETLTASRITAMKDAGLSGKVLQDMIVERMYRIGPQNRPYIFNGVQDCYGFVRQVWNAVLYDGKVHSEDYYPNYYDKTRWLGVSQGIPVADAPNTDWVLITDLNKLLPGDILSTHQGHAWGADWHGGLYLGIINGRHAQYDNSHLVDFNWNYTSGAYPRPFWSGFNYYYKPLHDLLALEGRADYDAHCTSSSVPLELVPGEKAAVEIEMENSGLNSWTEYEHYRLGAGINNRFLFTNFKAGGYSNSTSDQRVFINGTVAHGQKTVFGFMITAPEDPGTYNLEVRMVRDGYAWFGETVNIPVKVVRNALDYECVGVDMPLNMITGEKAEVTISLKNTGLNSWTEYEYYRLGARLENDFLWSEFKDGGYSEGITNQRAFINGTVATNEITEVLFSITAPNTPGRYQLALQMVWDGVSWFPDYHVFEIEVSSPVIDESFSLEAEDFDSWYDTSPGNTGGVFRETDVDIAAFNGGYCVGWIETGEWLEFILQSAGGMYDVTARVASLQSAGFTIYINGELVPAGSISFYGTGDWYTFKTITCGSVTLPAGNVVVRVKALTPGLNLDWLYFEK